MNISIKPKLVLLSLIFSTNINLFATDLEDLKESLEGLNTSLQGVQATVAKLSGDQGLGGLQGKLEELKSAGEAATAQAAAAKKAQTATQQAEGKQKLAADNFFLSIVNPKTTEMLRTYLKKFTTLLPDKLELKYMSEETGKEPKIDQVLNIFKEALNKADAALIAQIDEKLQRNFQIIQNFKASKSNEAAWFSDLQKTFVKNNWTAIDSFQAYECYYTNKRLHTCYNLLIGRFEKAMNNMNTIKDLNAKKQILEAELAVPKPINMQAKEVELKKIPTTIHTELKDFNGNIVNIIIEFKAQYLKIQSTLIDNKQTELSRLHKDRTLANGKVAQDSLDEKITTVESALSTMKKTLSTLDSISIDDLQAKITKISQEDFAKNKIFFESIQ